MDGRFTLANMAIEIGAKSAAVRPDEITRAYADARVNRAWEPVWSDPGAELAEHHTFDVTALGPLVSLPDAPDRAVPLEEAGDEHVDPGLHRHLHERSPQRTCARQPRC